MRKHFFNTHYFDDINTPEKAYWLGFISADGYVSHGRIEIALAERDINHVKLFAKCIGYNEKLQSIKRSNGLRITLYSVNLSSKLNSYGIKQNKSLVLSPWQGPQHLMQHYWRGFFDGDGHFACSYKKRKNGGIYIQWECGLISTWKVVRAFKKYIFTNATQQYRTGKLYREGKVWRVLYGGIRPCQSVASSIYTEYAYPCLNRKKELAQKILETSLKPTIISHLDKKFLLSKFKEELNWENVAKCLGISRNGLYKHLRRIGIKRRKWERKTNVKLGSLS